MPHQFTTLPRPHSTHPTLPPIPAPSEFAFTATFGALLPPAQYLRTRAGKAAYYSFPPRTPPGDGKSQSSRDGKPWPSRVLLVHGVQTPALGLLPLVKALKREVPGAWVVCVDLWGHGISEAPVVPCEGGLFAGLVGELVGELGWGGDGDGDGEDGEDGGVAIVGYSFGAVVTMDWLTSTMSTSTSTSTSTSSTPSKQQPSGKCKVHSYSLIAPAGLLRSSRFTPTQREWLSTACTPADEERAANWVVRTLEGGDLVVPADWRERVGRGEVVAEKLREWQMQKHAGHAASVVGIFRDGGVMDNEALFREVRRLEVPGLVVLGAEDDLSTEEELVGFGFDVRVVKDAGHAVVREKAGEVAECIGGFWRGLA